MAEIFCDWSKLKAFADNEINWILKLKFELEIAEIFWKEEKMLIPSIFSFPHNVFKRLFPRVVKS